MLQRLQASPHAKLQDVSSATRAEILNRYQQGKRGLRALGSDAENDEQAALKALLRELSQRMTKTKKMDIERRREQTIEELHEADLHDRA